MSVLMVPKDTIKYPSLGPQVADWMEAFLIFGPGDMRGKPYKLDQEKRAFLSKIYQVYPQGHPLEGRRRFNRAALSIAKGSAKTEFGAGIVAAELHPEAPVRCDGFDGYGQAVGRPVTDPYIPMIAYTEEQSDELAYYALYVMLSEGPLADDFDIGLERIMRVNGDGKAISLSGSPNARDGARTTMQYFDETHRFTQAKQKDAHRTMMHNLPKRYMSDAWSLETTTSFTPGEGSVAEKTFGYAMMIEQGEIDDEDSKKLFFFHRQASDGYKLQHEDGTRNREQIRTAVIEARGWERMLEAAARGEETAWERPDLLINGIVELGMDPTTDINYFERVYLNRPVKATDKAFSLAEWESLADVLFMPPPRSVITLGFDGARWRDSVGLVATHLKTGFQWPVGLWEKPLSAGDEWEAPEDQIDARVELMFEEYQVVRMYCDPYLWETKIAEWAGRHGEKVVVEWRTNREKPMGFAIKAFETAIHAKELSHNGDANYSRHIANAKKKKLPVVDEHGNALYTIYKEGADSPHKIDLAMAGILSWEARTDALTAGVDPDGGSVYDKRGILTL